MINGIAVNAGDTYTGSFDFDIDGSGQPENVTVDFELSEAP